MPEVGQMTKSILKGKFFIAELERAEKSGRSSFTVS